MAKEGGRAEEDRPLVLEFSTSWCGACKHFSRYTLADQRVKRALDDVRFVHVDGDEDPAEARRCGVQSYPTFVALDEDGKVVARIKGAVGAVQFIDFLQWGAPNAFDEAAITRRMAARPSIRGLLYQARLQAMNGHMPAAVNAYRKALELAPDAARTADIEWELALLESAGSSLAALAERAARFAVDHPDAANSLGAAEIALVSRQLAPDGLAALAERLLAVHARDGEALNGLAYGFLSAGALDHALAAARRQVEIAPSEANAYDTLAEVYHQRGDRAAALANSDRAIALAQQSDSKAAFERNRERFAAGTRDPGPSLEGTQQRVEQVLRRYRIAR
jgi:thioredoxin-like negative regulator of GroEL